VRWHPTPGAKKNILGWDIAPFGIYKLIKWVNKRYSPRGGIVITENGLPTSEKSIEAARKDTARQCYIKQYLQQIARTMDEGVNVRGYFYWSLLDNFEWAEGYTPRFGLVHVDYNNQRRVAKGSAALFAKISQSHSFTYAPSECNASAPMLVRFRHESTELQRLVNATVQPQQELQRLQQVALRTQRLAALAEVQARYDAEQGEFGLMRFWGSRAKRLRAAAEKQKQRLKAAMRAKAARQKEAAKREQADAFSAAQDSAARAAWDTPPVGQRDGGDDAELQEEMTEEMNLAEDEGSPRRQSIPGASSQGAAMSGDGFGSEADVAPQVDADVDSATGFDEAGDLQLPDSSTADPHVGDDARGYAQGMHDDSDHADKDFEAALDAEAASNDDEMEASQAAMGTDLEESSVEEEVL